MSSVEPTVLKWARETAGLSLEEAAAKIGIRPTKKKTAPQRIEDFESGVTSPTRPQLVKMSKQYRRPLVAFYLSAPPRQGDRGQDFRTLPDGVEAGDDALLDALIRGVLARQGLVRAALEDEDEAVPLSFVGSLRSEDGVENAAARIAQHIGFDIDAYRTCRSSAEAFAFIREAVESTGVYVLLIGDLGSHHTAIDLQVFRGFALADPIAPFVVLNDKDSHAAWAFSLLHELVHVWLGETGVSGGTPGRAVERFCNEVASEILVPAGDFKGLGGLGSEPFRTQMELVSKFASARNVSQSMVAYRLYRCGVLEEVQWKRLRDEYRRLWASSRQRMRQVAREREGGPDFYIVRAHRVGGALLHLVRRLLAGGTLTTAKSARVLGVKAHQVTSLLDKASF